MPDIKTAADLETFKQGVCKTVEVMTETLKRTAEEAIKDAELAQEGREQLQLLPELLKDAPLCWVGETDIDPRGSSLNGGSVMFLGSDCPHLDFGHDLPSVKLPTGRYRFFLIGFPVKFESEVADDG